MIETARIENFKLFEQVEISGLSRVNIVVGDNTSGKTSLLEASLLQPRARLMSLLDFGFGAASTPAAPPRKPFMMRSFSIYFTSSSAIALGVSRSKDQKKIRGRFVFSTTPASLFRSR
jgi:predicted ATP-dependent endonuclease of OLD family